ncbi:unnamed protein product, partial [Choristocarpus tenellus]
MRLNAFETWSFDSGASNSVTKDSKYMYDFAPCPQGHNMTVADGTSLPIMGYGKIDLNFNVGRDEWVHVILTSVAYVPKVAFNLLSSHSAGRAKEVSIKLIGDEYHICDGEGFPLFFKWNGSMYAANTERLPPPDETPLAATVSTTPMHITVFHHIVNHTGEKILRHTAKKQGITLTGNLASTKCIGCAKGINIKDSVPKSITARARGPFTRIFIDLTGPKKVKSRGGAEYALAIVDDATRFTWIRLLPKKSYATKTLRRWFMTEVLPSGRHIKYIRHDPGGEWQGEEIQELVMEMGAVQEMTRTREAQYNGVVKRRIAQVDSGARVSIYSAGLEDKMWLWGEAYNHSAFILNRSATVANKGTSP